MKTQYVILTLAAGSLVILPALSQGDDPFAPGSPAEPKNIREALYDGLPKLIQVQVEWIELDHAVASDLLFQRNPKGDSTALRKEVQELVKKDKAVIVETAICLSRPGQKATTESIREKIYPTEYEPAETPMDLDIDAELDATALSQLVTPPTPTAFETRNVGTTVEIEPNVGADGKTIDLRFSPEIVIDTGEVKWQTIKDGLGNENNIKMPLFYSLRVSTALTMRDGQYRFAGLLTPGGDDGESDRTRKIMMFVKCDLVAIGEEEIPEREEALKKKLSKK